MNASFNMRGSRYVGVMMFLSLIVGGCSMFSEEAKVQNNAKGSVYLKEIADWSFGASHPAAIDQMTMLKVVKGVVTDDVQKGSNNTPASGSKPMRMFSDEDAEFLAPLLAQGLSQAKPEQIVGFKVSPSAGSGAEPTAGTLYIHKGSIYLTIAPSHNRKASGFAPSSAARLEKAPIFYRDGKRSHDDGDRPPDPRQSTGAGFASSSRNPETCPCFCITDRSDDPSRHSHGARHLRHGNTIAAGGFRFGGLSRGSGSESY